MSKVNTVGGGEAGTRGAHFRLAEPTCTPRLDLAGRRRVVYESIVHIKSVGRRMGAGPDRRSQSL